MAKYVPDIMSRRWVIISESRVDRPDETSTKKVASPVCPFCPGNEHPDETYRVGEGSGIDPGWEVRVIKNKYPITDYHEVIIHSPDPEKDLHHLPSEHIVKVFQAFRARYNEYRDRGQVMIFCNRGEHAGASIRHPHSQLVVIPSQINLDTLIREPVSNIVDKNTYFHIYCPDFSQWPYEVWIAPERENTKFGDITDPETKDLTEIYVTIMKRLEALHEKVSKTGLEFAYNFYIHPKENWYMRIIPRFVHRAGFELGTGLSVNVTDPSDAARELRNPHEEMRKLLKKLEELKKQDEGSA